MTTTLHTYTLKMSGKQSAVTMSEKKREMHDDLERQSTQPPPARASFLALWLTFVLACMGTIILSNWNEPNTVVSSQPVSHRPRPPLPTHIPPPASAPTSSCDPLSLRREWRTLSAAERTAYQTSLRCLMYTPSVSGTGSLYNDFLATYEHKDWASIDTSHYLPWNRWFLHAFESAMRRECAYTGDMVYTDWTQDLTSILIEEIKTSSTGSDQRTQQPIGEDATHTSVEATHKSIDHLNSILSAATYDDFVDLLERHLSTLSPLDLFSSEAPHDPMFLHQMQIDRLWWLWQERNVDAKMPLTTSVEKIKLDGLVAPVKAEEVLKTEARGMCYRYL